MRRLFIFLAVSAMLAYGCSPGGETGGPSNGVCRDYDSDTICNEDEGQEERMDTDGDGIPDYQDEDSDNDGIPDSVEAGDDDPSTPPVDTDADDVPDYRDTDSDDNGIPDKSEGISDLDGDGYPNYRDTDNDGDGIIDKTEIGGDPYNPRNTDGNYEPSDLIPDYNDPDSDNDGIADVYEKNQDPDGDGIPNYMDLDSDGDGIPDSAERGTNGDLAERPRDSDGDGYPDVYDVDSDNDGLRDDLEDANHNGVVDPGESDPTKEDTDGDGVSDMIEQAAGTDPANASDNPRTRGDFVFMEPYMELQEPSEDVLDFSTSFKSLDIMFTEDISGSMSDEINSIRNTLASLLEDLICDAGEDPNTTGCIPSVESGVEVFGGTYEGRDCDSTFCLAKSIDDNNVPSDPGPDSQCTYNKLPTNADGGTEYGVGAVWDSLQDSCAGFPNRIGKGCYREDALKVAILVTDESLQQGGYYSTSYFDPISANGVGVILIYTGDDAELQSQGVNMVSSGGQHLVPQIDPAALSSVPDCQGLGSNVFYQNYAIINGTGTTAGQAMKCAVKAVSAYMPQDVEAMVLDGTNNVDAQGNPVDARQAFIDHIEVFMSGDSTCPSGYNTTDSDGDGAPDKFVGILPGHAVCWKIYSKQNDTVEPTDEPQMFTAIVEVHGAGGALLDSREVYFLVPPVIEGPGGPDK